MLEVILKLGHTLRANVYISHSWNKVWEAKVRLFCFQMIHQHLSPLRVVTTYLCSHLKHPTNNKAFYYVLYSVLILIHYADSRGVQYMRRPYEAFSPHAASSFHTQPPGPQRRPHENTLALVGSPSLNKQLSSINSLPSKQWVSGNAEQSRPKRVLSASGRRAKQGFRYWPQEMKGTPQGM